MSLEAAETAQDDETKGSVHFILDMSMQDLKFRGMSELLGGRHSYIEGFKRELSDIDSSLPDNLSGIDQLPKPAQQRVIDYLLQTACMCQNMLNIELGRAGLLVLPREWLVTHLREAIERNGLLADDWAYRRLLEVVWKIDLELLRDLVGFGLGSTNEDIAEAAAECREELDPRDSS